MQIIVLGMHRSGTSTLARILNLMGCYFGSEDVSIGARADNPKGFWERADVIDLNERILRAAGGSWWDVAPLDMSAIDEQDLAWFHKRIHDTILKLDAHRPWFVKDPRMCLTLDFWLQALDRPVFIYINRSPVQIAKSLHRRNGIPLEYGLALWEYYTRTALHSLGNQKYISIAYESLLNDPVATVRNLMASLTAAGAKGLRMPEEEELRAFVQPSLCHFADDEDADLMAESQRELLAKLRNGECLDWLNVARLYLVKVLDAYKIPGDWTSALEVDQQEDTADLASEKQHARIDELLARNAALTSRNQKMEDALVNITQSRVIRVMTRLYATFSLDKKGLAAEIKRINALLGQSGVVPLGYRKTRSRYNVIRRAVTRPMKTLRLLYPQKLGRALMFILTQEGGLKKLYARYVEFHLRDSDVEMYPESVSALIQHYALPSKSTDVRPPLPADDEVLGWSNEVRRLAAAGHGDKSPAISIVIPVFNQIRYTLACVHSILLHTERCDYEIIIADDGSNDQTAYVFSNPPARVRYIRNESNLGFLRNCNNAAESSLGEIIVFLNNDVVVLPGWLDELSRTLADNPTIGLVGSKLIYPEGRLQEAGGIVFKDGSGWNYGRFDNTRLPKYNYLRDVDYCSGASLAIAKDLWQRVGGFDIRYAPAYYEDTDLAFKVRDAGYRVVYQPRSQIIHFEGVSHGTSTGEGVKKHQATNREVFRERWADVLKTYGKCEPSNLPVNRVSCGRILVVDATTPTPDKDSGSLDTFNYMRIFKECNYHVTFVPLDMARMPNYSDDLERIGIECIDESVSGTLESAVRYYAPRTDIVIFHRVHVARKLLNLVRSCAPSARIIFDTVDLHFLRESREAELFNCNRRRSLARKTRDMELEMIRQADSTLLRSEYELDVVRREIPDARLHVMPIVREVPGRGSVSWEERKNIVFIGGFSHPPNVDAVRYFIGKVWPVLQAKGFAGKFVIAGSNMPDEIKSMACDDVLVLGFVTDLAGLFDSCRLTVAPLRYGAGLKGKVISSLSHGVPCIATPVAVEGSGFIEGTHVLVEDEPEMMAKAILGLYDDRHAWESLSDAGVAICREKFSFEVMKKKWVCVFSEVSN